MSEEAAFLEVLKANPADDTARLVYADWLDEHDEPRKAEYLRLITRLPRRSWNVEIATTEATRTNELGATLASDWKESAAGRFDVVLLKFTDKVRGIICVRELFKIGLRDAKEIVESAPIRLLVRAPFDLALSYFTRLADKTGMTLAIRRSEQPGTPKAVVYQVIAGCSPLTDGGSQPYGADPRQDSEAIDALARLVALVLGISLDEARSQVTQPRFLLAKELTFPAARCCIELCRRSCTREIRFETYCEVETNVREIP